MNSSKRRREPEEHFTSRNRVSAIPPAKRHHRDEQSDDTVAYNDDSVPLQLPVQSPHTPPPSSIPRKQDTPERRRPGCESSPKTCIKGCRPRIAPSARIPCIHPPSVAIPERQHPPSPAVPEQRRQGGGGPKICRKCLDSLVMMLATRDERGFSVHTSDITDVHTFSCEVYTARIIRESLLLTTFQVVTTTKGFISSESAQATVASLTGTIERLIKVYGQ